MESRTSQSAFYPIKGPLHILGDVRVFIVTSTEGNNHPLVKEAEHSGPISFLLRFFYLKTVIP